MSNLATRTTIHTPPPGMSSFTDALIACNGDVSVLRNATPLPKDAQELIDKAVIRVGLERLSVAADVMRRGLVFSLPNPMSIMEVYWEQESKVGDARRTMLPNARGENQLIDRAGVRVPVYCTMDDFSLNARTLMASRRSGTPLDTSMVEQATRRVNESIEDAFINGAGIAVGGNTAYGLLTAPNRALYQFTGGAVGRAWDDATKTGEHILIDVLDMVAAAQANFKYGPYHLWVGTSYGNKLNYDFKANGALTIKQRLQMISAGGSNLTISVADRLPQHKVVLTQMTSDVIDVIDGMQPTAVSWPGAGGFSSHFVVMAFVIPRIKDDYDGNSGVVVGSTDGT